MRVQDATIDELRAACGCLEFEDLCEPVAAAPVVAVAPFVPRCSERRVYVVRSGDFIKVGVTDDLKRRFRGLQATNPFDLELVASFPGDLDLERYIHRYFVADRHRFEWFRIQGAVADWLEGGCKPFWK